MFKCEKGAFIRPMDKIIALFYKVHIISYLIFNSNYSKFMPELLLGIS